jgi:hypothetical protein
MAGSSEMPTAGDTVYVTNDSASPLRIANPEVFMTRAWCDICGGLGFVRLQVHKKLELGPFVPSPEVRYREFFCPQCTVKEPEVRGGVEPLDVGSIEKRIHERVVRSIDEFAEILKKAVEDWGAGFQRESIRKERVYSDIDIIKRGIYTRLKQENWR